MKKLIIGAIASTLAVAGLSKLNKKENKQQNSEQMQLERERLLRLQQEESRRRQAEARENELNRRMRERENELNRRMHERENERNRRMRELIAIRQGRADNPIELTCPRCNGTRIVDRKKGIITCPYCKGVESLNPFHHYVAELDGVPTQSPPAPQRQNTPTNNNALTAVIIICCVVGLLFCCCCCSPMILGMYPSDSTSDTSQEETVKRINMPFDSSNVDDYNYDYAVKKLKEAGFTNVSAEPMGDLVLGILTKENFVDRIEVNGDDYFYTSSKFDSDADIVVFYHSFPKKATETNTVETSKTAETTKAVETSKTAETTKAVETSKATETTKEEIKENKSSELSITSEYEYAFVRELSEYSIYYMFDTDANSVINFITNDGYIMRGTFSGDFSSEISINWVNDGYSEKLNINGNKATIIDGNGFDWEYRSCDVLSAQEELDNL